jgi:oligopeptide transport system substrate-binding protein
MRLGTRKVTLSGIFATAGALALLLSACGGSSSTQSTASTGPAKGANQKITLYWASGGDSADITTLDPGVAQDTGSVPPILQLFDGLVTLDQNLKPELWGADKLTVSADGLTYTYHLRAGQKFVDGTPVKASDYAFSMNRSENPCLASPVSSYLAGTLKDANTFATETCGSDGKTIVGPIQTLLGDSIVADDSAATVTLTLAQPAAYFSELMTYNTTLAIEQSALGDGLGADGTWLTNLLQGKGNSGMFQLKTWDHQGNIVLVPNPNWWGVTAGKKPNFTEIDYKIFVSGDTQYSTFVSDPTAAYNDLIPSAQIADAKTKNDFQQTPQLVVGGFAPNYKVAPFNNKDARLAFCEAIDRDSISHNIQKDVVVPSFHLVPNGMPGYNPNLKGPDGIPTSGDTTKALAHWNAYKATLNGAPVPAIKYTYNSAAATVKLTAQYYQATWNQLFGTNVTLDQVTFSTYLAENDQKTLQLARFGWAADYPDPQDFLTLLWSSTGLYNDTNVNVPAADALMAQADGISDPAKQDQRMSLYNQAEQDLVDDGAMCSTTTSPFYYNVRTWVYGIKASAQTYVPLDDWATGYLTTDEPSA